MQHRAQAEDRQGSPLVGAALSLFFATLRIAELGFLGVRVMTCTQTPRRNGFDFNAGAFVLDFTRLRGLRTN